MLAAEVSALLRMPAQTVHQYAREGKLPAQRSAATVDFFATRSKPCWTERGGRRPETGGVW
jgi:hypothetical protein